MKKIVQIKFGSHLYGTDTKHSDLDIKSVYIPEARDILLQRVKGTIVAGTREDNTRKNTAEDIDNDSYSPEKFLGLLAEGQTVALDMFFAPHDKMIEDPHPLWEDFQKLGPKLFNKQAASFIRYCRQQANKYGIKGSRVAAARKALDFLKDKKPDTVLREYESEVKGLCNETEFLDYLDIEQKNGSHVKCFEICGKKALMDGKVKNALSIAKSLMENYGDRALEAEKNKGIDWKALSHAVRVGGQAVEFLTTAKMTFPRPDSKHLVEIKQGKIDFKTVSEEIEQLLEEVEEAEKKSTLPEKADTKLIDDFIEELYGRIVRGEELSGIIK